MTCWPKPPGRRRAVCLHVDAIHPGRRHEDRAGRRVRAVEPPSAWSRPTRGRSGRPSGWCSARTGSAIHHDRALPGDGDGPRDTKPTSTKIVRALSRYARWRSFPGGIPIVDAGLLALAHRRALCGRAGRALRGRRAVLELSRAGRAGRVDHRPAPLDGPASRPSGTSHHVGR